ncbi:MAG: dihydropteroate synthase [Candidatus Brocadiaceae bacterium]
MLVIAERINATRKPIARAFQERDAEALAREVRAQAEAGADFIDLNAASDPKHELENLDWGARIIQEHTDLPLCLDSADPEVLRHGLSLIEGDTVMLNSVTAEEGKMRRVLEVAAESGALLIGLTLDDRGLPGTAETRLEITERLLRAAEEAGVERERLYIDPCIQPIATNPEQGMEVVTAVQRIASSFPGVHTTCGLSNISFGLPNRGLINRTYLSCLITAGLDSAILDPTEPGMMDTVCAAEALARRDEFCMNYIRTMRD